MILGKALPFFHGAPFSHHRFTKSPLRISCMLLFLVHVHGLQLPNQKATCCHCRTHLHVRLRCYQVFTIAVPFVKEETATQTVWSLYHTIESREQTKQQYVLQMSMLSTDYTSTCFIQVQPLRCHHCFRVPCSSPAPLAQNATVASLAAATGQHVSAEDSALGSNTVAATPSSVYSGSIAKQQPKATTSHSAAAATYRVRRLKPPARAAYAIAALVVDMPSFAISLPNRITT